MKKDKRERMDKKFEEENKLEDWVPKTNLGKWLNQGNNKH
jgi:hypothetical protein